jgi:hypothetical protein
MSEPKWEGPLTTQQTIDCLGIACCALDKIAEWTPKDSKRFGSQSTMAKSALDAIYRGGYGQGEK